MVRMIFKDELEYSAATTSKRGMRNEDKKRSPLESADPLVVKCSRDNPYVHITIDEVLTGWAGDNTCAVNTPKSNQDWHHCIFSKSGCLRKVAFLRLPSLLVNNVLYVRNNDKLTDD